LRLGTGHPHRSQSWDQASNGKAAATGRRANQKLAPRSSQRPGLKRGVERNINALMRINKLLMNGRWGQLDCGHRIGRVWEMRDKTKVFHGLPGWLRES
jgi:hypothetical protein